ncbi:MAG: hypothetical protein Q9M24_02835 [Mariprofundaceae bacterium]|nr:hypothetical protein [Mariprofundaceae bacterium]
MAKAYVVQDDGGTIPMNRIHCKNEDQELQRILEHNPDLLPGDQINPGDPRRWLIIEREMPVPDPASGSDRWSIDFFFADQAGMPTFIECKRYEDSRARREVIGQMLDYAANGHYYWTKGDMRDLAEKNAAKGGQTLDEAIQNLRADDDLGADDYFQRVEDNLREGQVRLVFFLEESSMELRSVVDFLNKQMERSEILIVEARQYLHEGTRVVVPTLFGYTEEARQVKRTRIETSGPRKKWDEESFFADASARLDENHFIVVKRIFDFCHSYADEISWGTGKDLGSFGPIFRSLSGTRPIIAITSRGRLYFQFGSSRSSEEERIFYLHLKELAEAKLGLPIPDDFSSRYPGYNIEEWAQKVDIFIEGLQQLVQKYRDKA